MTRADAPVESLRVSAFTVPTTWDGEPVAETDGTARWDSTTAVVVEATAGGTVGLGYAYTSPAAVAVIREALADVIIGSDAMDTAGVFWTMAPAVRNLGWAGIAASALSAVDVALHDLKARLLDVSLLSLLGGTHPDVAGYGSGGFTSYGEAQLREQCHRWVQRGFGAVKIKVGTDPSTDLARARLCRDALGPDVALYVDANGAYDRAQAVGFARAFAHEAGATWFEEPVTSDDLEGLRFVRDRAPGGMRIASGEYGYRPVHFRELLERAAVDVLQADATRCGGVTGFLGAAAQAAARGIPFSAHTSPALHASLAPAAVTALNVECFHDHELVERELFDGLPSLVAGRLVVDRAAAGHGLRLTGDETHLVERWES